MLKAMRLVVVIVNRGIGEEVIEFGHENNIDYAFLAHGRGTIKSEILSVLGLGTVDKDVVASLIPRYNLKTYLTGLSGLLKLKRPGKGIAFSIPLFALNALIAQNIENAIVDDDDDFSEERTEKPVVTKFNVIVAVVEAGFVEPVMDAAKEVGAAGGTLLHARGVGREAAETFMGASLQAEKEVIAILAPHSTHKDIMERINTDYGILSEAKGVVFSLPVDEIVGIG